nr:HAMP domain-containing sensor histidine kinase [Clostridioides sp.]
MRRIFDKWEKMSIKYKLFSITTSLLLGLALAIYLILYFMLPSYYHKYKIDSLEAQLGYLTKTSMKDDTGALEERLYYMAKDQNLAILLKDHNGRVVYGKNEVVLLKYSRYMSSNINDEYRVTMPINTSDSEEPYTLEIIMPLQPIDEASEVIRNLMPYIIAVAIIIAVIGAFIYSNVITKPLIEIIEIERKQENNRKDFVATISHELKTPITIISGQIEGMIYNVGKYRDRDTYLKKSYDCTQELKELVEEMIEISKMEILDQDLNLGTESKQIINMSELLQNLVKRQLFLIEEKNIDTSLSIQEDVTVIANTERISRAINNIINNAIKYTPENEKIYVRLYKKSNARVILEVENTGITIEKKYLDEIFTPFYRIEKSRSRKTGGSGLGLYIVSQILKSHGFDYCMKNKDNSVVFKIEFKN